MNNGNLAKKIEYNKGLFNGYSHIYLKILGDLSPFETVEYDDFEELADKYEGYYDVYATENTLSNVYTRTIKDVLQLRALYIDLDDVVNIDDTVRAINKLVKEKSMPKPHKVIFSGTGIHVKWFLKDYAASNKKNMKVWSKLENYLIETFKKNIKDLAKVDTKVKDPSRVLRIVGTVNSKNDATVSVITETKIKNYDLYKLYNKFTPYKAQEPDKIQKPAIRLLKSKATLNHARLLDLQKLLELRDYDMSGIRNGFLMFYTTYYILVNNSNYEDTLQEIKIVASRINSKKYTTLSELKGFVRNGLKKVEEHKNGEKVLPKNETIIEWLEISEDEQKQLLTIKSKEIKKENNNAQRKEKRRNEAGLTQRELDKQELINKVKALKNKGLKQSEIAIKLNISKGTVSKYLKL